MGQSTDELASLEQRIKEMEERLRRTKSQHNRPAIDTVAASSTAANSNNADGTDALAKQQDSITYVKSENSRPGTARATQQAPSSGNMPPTPGASEGD